MVAMNTYDGKHIVQIQKRGKVKEEVTCTSEPTNQDIIHNLNGGNGRV